MKANIKAIASLLFSKHGIDASMYDESFLEKTIEKRVTEHNLETTEHYYQLLDSKPTESELLIVTLQNNYSEFFRNTLTFSVLEQVILPQIYHTKKTKKNKEIRVWSAACSAGQEAYSLAILLKEFASHIHHDFQYRIFATDKNELVVDDARAGVYTLQTLQKVNLAQLKTFFEAQSVTFVVKSELKRTVDFSVFDLCNEQFSCPPASIFGEFDIIMCANILFYYKPKLQKMILKKLSKSLNKGGYIIVGEAERSIMMEQGFEEVVLQSGIFRGLTPALSKGEGAKTADFE